MTMPKACGVLSDLDDQKKEQNCKPKSRGRDKHESKNKNIDIDINKLSVTQQNHVHHWVRRNLGHEKPDCRLIEKTTKDEWCINKKKSSKKKFNPQQIGNFGKWSVRK